VIDRLYKYGRLNEYSDDVFSSPRIWLGDAESQNDLYELFPRLGFTLSMERALPRLEQTTREHFPRMTDAEVRVEASARYLQAARDPDAFHSVMERSLTEEIRTNVGLYAMSESPLIEQMWAYYGDSHKGYCIEFEASDTTPIFGEAQQVSYSDDDPTVDVYEMPQDMQIQFAFLNKRLGWKHEREWRIVLPGSTGYRNYPEHLMKSVTFGIRMKDEQRRHIEGLLAKRADTVSLFEIVAANRALERVPMVPRGLIARL